MKPNIELHIDELVLHGFKSGDRYPIGEALERELIRLISEQGLPDKFAGPVHVPHLNAGNFSLVRESRAEAAGREIARMIHASLNGDRQKEALTTRNKR